MEMVQEQTHVLADGTRVHVRRIQPGDKDRLRAGLAAMSPESRYRRFLAPITELSDAQLRYLTEVDFENHFALVAEAPDHPGRPEVGVARWVRSQSDPDCAEAAIAVTDRYQHRGVGKYLLHLLVEAAIEHGVRRFTALVQAENKPMLTLLREIGTVTTSSSDGALQLVVELPARAADLDRSQAPVILRAVADGRLKAEAAADAIRHRVVLKGSRDG
jgi:GNAT superfamily N-acetyltransferase